MTQWSTHGNSKPETVKRETVMIAAANILQSTNPEAHESRQHHEQPSNHHRE